MRVGNREARLNDIINCELPDPAADYVLTLRRSAIVSMLRTAMRRGGELVAQHAERYKIGIFELEADMYTDTVRFEAIETFMEESR